MKFFWKIFLSTILISVTFFSIGAYYLIFSGFQYSLEREITSAYEENEILVYSLTNEMQASIIKKSNTLQSNESLLNNWIKQTADSITISTYNGVVPFRISNHNYSTLYQSRWVNIDHSLLSKLPKGSRGYKIIFENGIYYIHTASPITVLNKILYVENYRNITDLFENREQQHQKCYSIMLLMLILIAGVTFLVSSWLTKPIRTLSQATKKFANSDFSQRINIISNDEIGMLSKDFNSMAQQLELTIHELKESAERQENFTGSFAHELKTPLTSMIGYADMLRSKIMDPEQVVLSANYIFEEGKRLEALSMKLMDLIVLKKHNFTFKKIHAQDFMESIESTIRPILENEKIEFTCTCDNALLYIEPDLLKTVCINLLDNARKAIVQNGKISLVGEKKSNGYSICVNDNGRGMKESELTKITQAFYMVDKSRARSQGGAGLGLSICAEIIKLHGGTLTFESELGKGTSAIIHLKGGDEQ